jgi:RNA processing factor Prp31
LITYINFKANNLTVEIDNEINVIHKYIRDKYSKRFPELESLVPNALDYIRTVKELGNRVENAKNNEVLQKYLTTATIMVIFKNYYEIFLIIKKNKLFLGCKCISINNSRY